MKKGQDKNESAKVNLNISISYRPAIRMKRHQELQHYKFQYGRIQVTANTNIRLGKWKDAAPYIPAGPDRNEAEKSYTILELVQRSLQDLAGKQMPIDWSPHDFH